MSPWQCLSEELDHWYDAGKTATFWWRDDDAVAPSLQLEGLLRCAGPVPLCLAVIPDLATAELAERLKCVSSAVVLQHGWRHSNHAADGKSEYPPSRSGCEVERELAAGRSLLAEYFGAQSLPAFVPPWHGFDDRFLRLLPQNGITHLSRMGPRPSLLAAQDLVQVNAHVAPIRWTSPRSFGDEAEYLCKMIDHLRGRRTGRYDVTEPTGLLTHHLVQDTRSYKFVSELLNVILQHSAARWLDGKEIFGGYQ